MMPDNLELTQAVTASWYVILSVTGTKAVQSNDHAHLSVLRTACALEFVDSYGRCSAP